MLRGKKNGWWHDHEMESPAHSLVGSLLLASSVITDSNFRKTVVLIVDHGSEGAFGLVLNRPAPLPVEEAAPALACLVDPGASLYLGGPVQPQTPVVLAELDRFDLASKIVLGSICVLAVGTEAEAAELAEAVRRGRVFAGYAGWGPGQLEGELAQSAWIVEPASPSDVFTEEPGALWAATLRRKGGHFHVLALMPWDPSTN
jgi:putative transcriptional regulator